MAHRRLLRARRWGRLAAALGAVTQTGTCAFQDQFGQVTTEVVYLVLRQTTNIISDTVFFFLDNFLVRWVG